VTQTLGRLLSIMICMQSAFALGQSWSGDTLTIQAVSFQDPSPMGWNAQYKTNVDFPEQRTWSKILMIQRLKCDAATAGDQYPCGEWDYIWNTLLEVPTGDTTEWFSLGSFVTPYGKRLKLGGENGWSWVYDVSDYAPLLIGKRNLITGNNQELLDLKFLFIKGMPPREVLSVKNIYPYGDYRYEDLATDSLLKEKKLVLSADAAGFKLKATISGHGHAGPYNCCEWDSKTHTYYLNKYESFRWNVWKDCGANPIYPQGGTWPFDRAGWCPGTRVDEYSFEITPKVMPGDTILLDYQIEHFRDNGEKDGHFRMSHQLISYGPPISAYDAVLVDIRKPSSADNYSRFNPSCDAPEIVIMNGGSRPLKSLRIEYGMEDKRRLKYDWVGDLAFLEQATITLPSLPQKYLKDSGSFEVEIVLQKDVPETNIENNKLISEFILPPVFPDETLLIIKTNDLGRARENRFMIADDAGLVWYYEDSFADSTEYRFPISLPKGCYQFVLSDDQEDGVSSHWWYRNSAPERVGIDGELRFENMSGDTLKTFNADFGESLTTYFMVK
jgi:hypothetical protein